MVFNSISANVLDRAGMGQSYTVSYTAFQSDKVKYASGTLLIPSQALASKEVRKSRICYRYG